MSIADNIKALRKKYNLTQAQLGDIAGVSDKAVWTWENGTAEPRMGAIQKMADYFDIKKSDIVDDNPSYYLDPEAAAFAQEISEKPGLRALFSAARDVKEEDLRFMVEMAERFKQESGED